MIKSSQRLSFPLRMPEDLRASIEEAAKANGRSVNAEIVDILRAVIGDDAGLRATSVEKLLKAVADRMGAAVQIHVTNVVPPAKRGK